MTLKGIFLGLTGRRPSLPLLSRLPRLAAVLCLAVIVAACQALEKRPPAQPAPPPAVKVIPEPAPTPAPPPAREALPPLAHQPSARPAYDPEAARTLRRGPAAPPPQAGTVRVCLLVPLSGSDARIGTSMLQAALLALFDTADSSLELLPYDTAGRTDQPSRAARLALADGCALFLGPLLAADVQTVAPLAAERVVPVVAFSSDRRVAGDGVFILGLTPQSQVERVLRFAAEKGLRRLAVLAPNDAYGATVIQTAKAVAAEGAISIAAVLTYAPATSDFSEIVGKLPAGAFDTLLIADGGTRLKAIARALGTTEIQPPAVQLLGTGLWDEPGLGAEPALSGAWYAAPDPAFRAEFESRYRAVFGAAPHRLATLAYDAMAMAALLAGNVGRDGIVKTSALTDPSGFLGRDGLFRFRPDGLAERRLAILQITPRETVVISPPEISFAGS
jgi:branched-chain amino acid transport system substrate-binding protein